MKKQVETVIILEKEFHKFSQWQSSRESEKTIKKKIPKDSIKRKKFWRPKINKIWIELSDFVTLPRIHFFRCLSNNCFRWRIQYFKRVT